MNRRIFVAAFAAMLTIGATRADGQITTVIAAPKRSEAVKVETARREAAAQDSVARVTLTDMKQWVDSAASALAVRPDTAGAPPDTGVAIPQAPTTKMDSAPAATPRTPAGVTPEFRDGARPPDTATPVPAIALVGGAMLVVGMLLRRRVTSTVRARQ